MWIAADKGLVAALGSQARKATLPVEVVANDVDRYPPEMEAAVYFCALEALQNVQKYAGATTAMEDRLDAQGGKLVIASEQGRFTRISGSLPLYGH
jgi:signal transduction histidine kinase